MRNDLFNASPNRLRLTVLAVACAGAVGAQSPAGAVTASMTMSAPV